MPRIKKYKINSDSPNDCEFIVTKTTRTITELIVKQRVDDQGNLLSSREGTEVVHSGVTIEEDVSAVSHPSKIPATITDIEYYEDYGSQNQSQDAKRSDNVNLTQIQNEIPSNDRGRPRAISIEKMLNPDDEGRPQPQVLPKPGEIKWSEPDRH